MAAAPSAPLNPGIDLQWDAPAECPDAASVRHDVEKLLGQSLDAPRRDRISARARVRRSEVLNFELELSLSVNGVVSDETLLARRCGALADTTALKLALATDPFAVVAAIKRAPADAAPSPFPASAPREVPSQAAQASSSGSRFGLRLSGGADLGAMSTLSPGVGLTTSLSWTSIRVELGAQAFGFSDVSYLQLPDVGAHLQLFSAVTRVCATPALGRVQFPVCAGVEGGVMRGRGFGASELTTASSAWVAVSVGPAIRIPLGGSVAVWIEADALATALRPGFRVRNLNTLYLAPAGASRGWLGIEVMVP